MLDGEPADLVWTDPPYGVDYVGKTKSALTIENDGVNPGALEELLRIEGLQPAVELSGMSLSTVSRWIKLGVRGVRLEATKNGRCWVTSAQALDRFRARLRGEACRTPLETTSSRARRARAADEARRKLKGRKS